VPPTMGLEDPPATRREDVEVLLATDIFQDLTPAALGGLLPAVKRHRLRRGEYFYRVQEPSTHLWVLISGQGKMSMPGPDGDETVLDVMLPGQLFGLPGLLATTTERVGSSVATEPCAALSIERNALLDFLEHHPAAMRRTLARLADLVREYAEAMVLAAHEDLRGRVARRLLDLATLHGEMGADGVRIGARVPQEVLGGMVGASRAKVNRALTALAADGHVRVDAGVITLLDPERLRRDHPDWFIDPRTRSISRGA
jgi:CRP/FNR family transcriptional regulator, cyclic AMP receptor protein